MALAVAIRALALSPTGVWDDVTDGQAQNHDLAYRRQRQALRTSVNACDRRACVWAAQCPLFVRLAGVEKRPGILAVNHAVVASWVKAIAGGGRSPGDVLGHEGTSLVFDEAHDLEESFTSAWTESVGAASLASLVAGVFGRWGPARLLRRALRQARPEAVAAVDFTAIRAEWAGVLDELGTAAATYIHEYGGKGQQAVLGSRAVRSRPEYRALVGAAMGARGFLRRLSAQLSTALTQALVEHGAAAAGRDDRMMHQAERKVAAVLTDISDAVVCLERVRDLPDPQLFVHLLSAPRSEALLMKDTWEFHSVPIDIGPRFRSDVVARAHSVVLTSATLTVGGSLTFLANRLGLDTGDEPGAFKLVRVDGPFDYHRQSMLILTSHLPLPVPGSEEEFCEEFASDLVGFTSLSEGRTLALFVARKG